MKTLLCCIGKNENEYAREYVEWYKNLGYTNICLYDNNDVDGEKFEDVIGDYIDSGFVILKNYRGEHLCQMRSYHECYAEYGNEYDWITICDMDEFLVIKEQDNISDYLSQDKFKGFDMIHINWVLYSDNNQIENTGGPINERLTEPIPTYRCVNYDFPENCHVKSIIRGGLGKINMVNPHTALGLRCCNNDGMECDGDSPFLGINYNNSYFKHFLTKTAREYALKMKRGYPDQFLQMDRIRELIERIFFRTNRMTKEKLEVFKEELGEDFSYLWDKPNI